MCSPLRAQTHPGEDVRRLPPPDRLVPLYLYLLNGQPKEESGRVIDAPTWLHEQADAGSRTP
jgi:hypothetical protein